jgi:hypothetical protein
MSSNTGKFNGLTEINNPRVISASRFDKAGLGTG